MAGTFSSINTGLSGLRYNRVAMDIASSNIANVGTEGYTRRRVEASATGAPPEPALWSRWDGAGDGVRVDDVARLSDALLQNRVRQEHSAQSYLDIRAASLGRFEDGVGEPGEFGVAAMLGEFRKAWSDLDNHPDSVAARQQVITRATALADAINIQARNVDKETAGQRMSVLTDVNAVNIMASDLAATNQAIIAGRLDGTDVNNLLDTRDLLATKLAELSGATSKEMPNGSIEVKLGGITLVSGKDAGTLNLTGGVTATGGADGAPVTWSVSEAGTGTPTAVTTGGKLGGSTELLNTTYPGYLNDLGAVAKNLADLTNAQHAAGYDRAGNAGGPIFSYSAANPAGTLAVVITDPQDLAASSIPGGNNDTENADRLATMPGVEDAYQKLVSGLGNTVASAQRLAGNQKVVTEQIDGAREQQAGINLDEEMVSLMAAQRGYQAAARVMSVVDSFLDTLINRTGV